MWQILFIKSSTAPHSPSESNLIPVKISAGLRSNSKFIAKLSPTMTSLKDNIAYCFQKIIRVLLIIFQVSCDQKQKSNTLLQRMMQKSTVSYKEPPADSMAF